MSDSITITEMTDIVSSEESSQETVIDKKKKPRKKSVSQTDSIVIDSSDVVSDAETNESVKDKGSADEVTTQSGVKFETAVRFRLFETSVSSKPSKYVKGTFFIHGDDVIAGRIRITDSLDAVGMPNKYIGWANIDEISKYVKEV